MKLQMKFNLILFAVLLIGVVGTSWFSYTILQKNAQNEILNQANLLMESALAVRKYTVEQVKPNLASGDFFLPQSVPAFGATEVFKTVQEKYPEFSYKEATLNPTNPRDQAIGWEVDIVEAFRSDPTGTKEIVGTRKEGGAHSLYMARPIAITNPACLACHSRPQNAPPAMIAKYGDKNGFGWQLNEIVGAQIVTVPMNVPIAKANKAFYISVASLVGVFIFILIIMNIMMRIIIIKPIKEMSQMADDVSMGKPQVKEFIPKGNDEVEVLGVSFNRMRRSLEKAMKMLKR